jgi:hypothetical protein
MRRVGAKVGSYEIGSTVKFVVYIPLVITSQFPSRNSGCKIHKQEPTHPLITTMG